MGPLATIAEALPNARSVRVENAFPGPEGGWELVLTLVDDADPVASLLEEMSDVTVVDLDRMGPNSDVFHLFLVSVDEPFVLETLLSAEAIPDRIRLAGGSISVAATVRDWDHLKELGSEIERVHGRFELVGVTETDHPGLPFGGANLTHVIEAKMGQQRLELLENAYERGFFEVPRRVSEAELAEVLGISQSTVSERLRTAEHTLLGIVFGQY